LGKRLSCLWNRRLHAALKVWIRVIRFRFWKPLLVFAWLCSSNDAPVTPNLGAAPKAEEIAGPKSRPVYGGATVRSLILLELGSTRVPASERDGANPGFGTREFNTPVFNRFPPGFQSGKPERDSNGGTWESKAARSFVLGTRPGKCLGPRLWRGAGRTGA